MQTYIMRGWVLALGLCFCGYVTAQDREGRIDTKLDRLLVKPLGSAAVPKGGARSFSSAESEERKEFIRTYSWLIEIMKQTIKREPNTKQFKLTLSKQSWLGTGSVSFTTAVIVSTGRVAYSVNPRRAQVSEQVLNIASGIAVEELEISGQYSFTLVDGRAPGRGTYGVAGTYSKTDPRTTGAAVTQKFGIGVDYQIGSDDDRFIPSVSLGHVSKTGKARESSLALTVTDDKSIQGVSLDYTLSQTEAYDGANTTSTMGFDVTASFSLEFASVAINYAFPTRSGGEYDYSITLARPVGESSIFFRYARDNVFSIGFRTPLRMRF